MAARFVRRPSWLAAAIIAALVLTPGPASAHPPAKHMPTGHPAYPVTQRVPVKDQLHGETLVDEYRWLEDGESAQVKSWTDAQNILTRKFLDALPARNAIKSRVRQLVSPARQDPPVVRGNRRFYKFQDGTTPQAVLMVQEGPTGTPRKLIDVNPLAADGTISLDWWEVSPHGEYVAYGLSEGGDEQSVLHVIDVKTGKSLGEAIAGCRYASVAWTPDALGFYYTRFPEKGADGKGKQAAFYHSLGADPDLDHKVFAHPGGPEMIHWVQLSGDGRHLLVGVYKGSSSVNELYYQDLKAAGSSLKPLATGFKAMYQGDVHHGVLYLRTTENAPRGKVLAIDLANTDRKRWKVVIPQGKDALQGAFVAGGKLVAEYLHDATSQVRLFDLSGRPAGQVPLPGLGTVSGLTGMGDQRDLYFHYTSFVHPTSVLRYDVGSGKVAVEFAPKLPIAPAALVQRQVWFRSKDGTRVPMFLVHKRGLQLDGKNPTLLTGYGGFDISITPHFSANDYVWVERGGVLAVPSLRGGGEFGQAWHEAGMRGRKQNVFDDFFGAARWLIRSGITSSRHLGIEGGSNGGLLVGAALTQRPELFRAVICAVPLLDMVRYHKFLIARYWIPEYGSADDAKQYRWLKAYSPYHHVAEGTRYPATLITTGESDTRVDPLHARKMAALLQHAQGGGAPILLNVERRAGHGAGKPLTKRVEDAADQLGFMAWQLGE